jgi:hypothetical protein
LRVLRIVHERLCNGVFRQRFVGVYVDSLHGRILSGVTLSDGLGELDMYRLVVICVRRGLDQLGSADRRGAVGEQYSYQGHEESGGNKRCCGQHFAPATLDGW